jgi:geranylgeranyl reductase family protein
MQQPEWNHDLSQAAPDCDVLVVGAGPSGSACAQLLAAAGLQVQLVDAQAFPRDKTCGDGLVPDTHAALRRLGLLDQVLAVAQPVGHARCVGPNGQHIDVAGELAVIPRRQLDAIVCQSAVAAGARMIAPARFETPLLDDAGRVIGARLSHGDVNREVKARWVVLATGATPSALVASGVCQRRSPTGMALRAYVRHPGLAQEIPALRFVWHPRLTGGYGWIFPGPDGVFNIGTGLLTSSADLDKGSRKPDRNLRTMFDDFVAIDPMARRLMQEGEVVGELKGAPLRCDLDGATWASPGLLVTGEAAGATYTFTGEGIGKAMETGMAAADALIAALNDGSADGQVLADYSARMAGLQPRFQMYRRAASFNRYPWLINLVIWRARGSANIRARLADILAERRMPGSLLSWRGLRRLVLG